MHALRHQRLFARHEVCALSSEVVREIDKHLTLLSSEIAPLRNRPEQWAARKADQWEALRQTLQRLRQEKQMTGMSGRPIE